MNKKWLTLVLVGTLFLGACGNTIDEPAEEEAEDSIEEVIVDAEAEDEADVEESEEVTETVLKTSSTGEETQESGPFKVTLKNAQLAEIEPTDSQIKQYGGEELVMLSVSAEVTNQSEDLNTIKPDQALVFIDTGQQTMADTDLTDKVGGEFDGVVTKKGELFFIFSGKTDDISTIRCLIDTGHDADYNRLGENLEFVFEF